MPAEARARKSPRKDRAGGVGRFMRLVLNPPADCPVKWGAR